MDNKPNEIHENLNNHTVQYKLLHNNKHKHTL